MLELTLFGAPQIHLHGRPVTTLLAKSQALIFYLALSGRAQSRLALATLLWPEKGEAEALTNLRQVIYDVRRKAPDLLETTHQRVQFASTLSYASDVERFVQQCGEQHSLTLREAALTLYSGDFLAGFYLAESAPFEEWIAVTRERLHQMAIQTLTQVMLHYSHRRQSAGLTYASRLLELEPWNEQAHRQKMLFLAWSGQRHAALAHYQQCQAILAAELGVAPEAETVRVFEQIRSGEEAPASQELGDEKEAEKGRAPQAISLPAVDNLPLQSTRFVGRTAEVTEVVQRLLDPDCRLITLVGLGGIGKTRLAIEAARQATDAFYDGVCFVDLTAIETISQAPAAIAAALKLPMSHDVEPLTAVVAHLAPQTRLLVLDNLEHLQDSAGLIMTLLHQAPALKILGSSRIRLNLQAEWVIDVYGLAAPQTITNANDAMTLDDVATILQHDAVQLFVQSARRVSASFAIDAHNAAAVAAICRMTGGAPLAIELAAGWVRVTSCRAIAEEIIGNLDRLTTTMAGIPNRQRSIHSVLVSTWQHLREDEQQALLALATLRGAFDQRAALTIASADLVMVATFIEHALVMRRPPERYQLHELMRQFLYQKLSMQPELFYSVSAAHARYYASFLQSYHDLEVGDVATKVQAIEADLENIRAAWRWLLEHPAAQDAITHLDGMVDVLHHLFDVRSHYREGAAWFNDALVQLEPLLPHHPVEVTMLCGRIMSRLARFHYYLGNFVETEQLTQRSMAIAQRFGHATEIAFCQMRFGYLAKNTGNHRDAIIHFTHAHTIYAEVGDRTGLVWALNGLGLANQQSGHLSASRNHFFEAWKLAGPLNNLMLRTIILNNLGVIYADLGDYTHALATLQECLHLNEYLGDQEGVGYAHWSLAATLSALGQQEAAHKHSMAALHNFQAVGHQRGIAYALIRTGEILLMDDRIDEAADSLQQAQDVVQRFTMRELVPISLLALAKLYLSRQQLAAAHAHVVQALAECQSLNIQTDAARVQVTLGEIALARQQLTDAQAHFHAALVLAQALELIPLLLEAIAGLAYVFQHAGKSEQAISLLTFVVSHRAATTIVHQQAQRTLHQMELAPLQGKPQTAQRTVADLQVETILAFITGRGMTPHSVD